MTETCENCEFWQIVFKGDSAEPENFGECRKYAPRILSGSGTGWSDQHWPHINKNQWCGEWEAKE